MRAFLGSMHQTYLRIHTIIRTSGTSEPQLRNKPVGNHATVAALQRVVKPQIGVKHLGGVKLAIWELWVLEGKGGLAGVYP